eukprot:scaffold21430_cov48-Phaeocystis_antarctica.AAC.2
MLTLLSRIPVGFGGLQAGLPGRGNASAPLPAVCPIRLSGGSAGARGGSVELHIINEHMGNLELLYVAGSTERRYWVIDARGDFKISTRAGDVWYLRTKTGTLAPSTNPNPSLSTNPNPNPNPDPDPDPDPDPNQARSQRRSPSAPMLGRS